jgi:site-specific DNA recombinase
MVRRLSGGGKWICLRAAYDDGGFSGATMTRPALQQLLADITAGRVDTVVVKFWPAPVH